MITLPDEIHLTAMRKTWQISYVDYPGKLQLVEEPNHELVVYGKRYSKRAVVRQIMRWIKLKAEKHLLALLNKLSRQTKIRYKKVYFHPYRNEWGNYSEDRTIGLNHYLIFLPPALVKHIIYHELCHSTNMQHTEKFWRMLGRYDKRWKKNRKDLEDAYEFIPEWAIF